MQDRQTHYQSINCWKCKTQNNRAKSKMCRHCGSYLKLLEKRESSTLNSFSIADFPFIKWIIAVFVFGVLFVLAVSFLQFKTGGDTFTGNAKFAEDEKANLPAESWYNKSRWSYIWANPSAGQVLEKNKEVSGKEIYPEILGTIQLKGKISIAKTPLHSARCNSSKQTHLPADEQPKLPYLPADEQPTTNPEEKAGCENSFVGNYRNIGEIELITKGPDKMLRVVKSPERLRNIKSVVEGFSESGAWRKTTTTDIESAILESKIEALSPEEILRAQKEIEPVWQTLFESLKNAEFAGLKRVNKDVAFVVKNKKNGETQTFYFDSVTGFLIKMELAEITVFFTDYKDYQGTNLPTVLYYRTLEDGDKYIWLKAEISAWQFGEFVDDAIFERPLK